MAPGDVVECTIPAPWLTTAYRKMICRRLFDKTKSIVKRAQLHDDGRPQYQEICAFRSKDSSDELDNHHIVVRVDNKSMRRGICFVLGVEMWRTQELSRRLVCIVE